MSKTAQEQMPPPASTTLARPGDFVVRSNLRGGLAVLRDWSLVSAIAGLAILADSWWASVAALLLIGRVQFAIGESLLHEASHHSLFRTRAWNDRLQPLYAWPFFVTLGAWRHEHLLHHRVLGTDHDHVVKTYLEAGLLDATPRTRWAWFGRPLVGAVAVSYVRSIVAMNRRRDGWVLAAFWAAVVGVFTWAGHPTWPLLYWVAPQLIVFAPMLYWSEIADHYRTRGGHRTRTGTLSNWLDHHNGFHEVHHRWMSIPFHQLAAAHDALVGTSEDQASSAWQVWRQISRAEETPPEAWPRFWPRAR